MNTPVTSRLDRIQLIKGIAVGLMAASIGALTRKFNMDTPTLTQQLADYKAGFIQRVPPERLAMMESATADLKASGIETHSLQVGDQAPDIMLPDANGRPVRLADLWRESMTVVIFYRGGWCPYCNLELRAWQHQLDALAQLGGKLVPV